MSFTIIDNNTNRSIELSSEEFDVIDSALSEYEDHRFDEDFSDYDSLSNKLTNLFSKQSVK